MNKTGQSAPRATLRPPHADPFACRNGARGVWLELPVQPAMGHPAESYPFNWSVYTWLPGENANGRLSAVIDWGSLNVGDPACDLQPVWNVFAGDSCLQFRDEPEASWLRGRGWALYQAMSALTYYWDTNPRMLRQASHALAQVLADSSP